MDTSILALYIEYEFIIEELSNDELLTMAGKHGKDLALSMLRVLPRLSLANIRDNPGSSKPPVSYS